MEKEVVDEIIFRTENPRNSLMLELMARGGMRVGEVLNLTSNDVEDRKVVIRSIRFSSALRRTVSDLKRVWCRCGNTDGAL